MNVPRAQTPPSADAPTLQLKVALDGGETTTEIQALLQTRLRVAFLLVSVAGGIMWILGAVNVAVNLGQVPPRMWQGLAINTGPLAAIMALTIFLWRRRSLSLTQLRAAELALVAFFALACGMKQLTTLGVARLMIQELGAGGMTILASYHALFWFTLLTLYSLFVPNTWRRCAVVVGLIAAGPFAVLLVAAAQPDWELTGRPLASYAMTLAMWMIFGATLAVFGSRHLEVLRRAVSEARHLGQYRLKQRLGVGGMGEVYLAEHLLLRRPCALKLIRPDQAGDPNNLARFEREVRLTATLTHPNTIQVFDYGHAEDGTFYYVMEYLPGLSLDQLVKQHGPPPPQRTIHLLRQICGALREAHAVGLIHRDIKPSNILLCERGGLLDVAKLLDFGLVRTYRGARDASDLTEAGTVVGTPAYMSPEQAGGQDALDARSDIYSLGALAYFLLTGRPPFAGKSSFQMLAAHMYEIPAPLTSQCPNVPGELQAVVLRCLAKDPANRYPDAHSLETALASCAAEGAWTQDQAADWWRSRSVQDDQWSYSSGTTSPVVRA